MPELPEVEITARLLGAALAGARVESALAPGVNALRTFDPPLDALAGRTIEGVGRRGKHLLVRFEGMPGDAPRGGPDGGAPGSGAPDGGAPDGGAPGSGAPGSGALVLLVHLMSAGRLQLYDARAGLRDRTSRVLIRLDDGRELRLREFGTRQAAWAKLLRASEVEADEALATLGPEAWPDPPAPEDLAALLRQPRPLHSLLRDQRVLCGVGRSWADEILWEARLSPFKRGADLSGEEAASLREATVARLGDALRVYEETLRLPLPDKLPLPLKVHRHEGEPCPRCGAQLQAVHFEDYVIAYCPDCQTDGKVLKDRRLSRLLK